MPRKPKRTTTPVEPPSNDATPAVASSVATADELVVFTNSTPTDAPLQESPVTTAPPTSSVDESAPEPQPERGRFRSWVTDTARGYSRLTDEQEQRLVVKFAQKPSADVLTALKGAGFHYHPDYAGQTNAWVRRNDFEGRMQVEAIEKLIGSLRQRDSTAR